MWAARILFFVSRRPHPVDHRRYAAKVNVVADAGDNPYESPSAPDTSSRSLAWYAFFALCALVSWLCRSKPHVTVILIAAIGAIVLLFVDAAVRRRRVWGCVSGLALAIILPIIFVAISSEIPITYAEVAAYRKKLYLILTFTVPFGVWAGIVLSESSPNPDLAVRTRSQQDG